MTQPDSIPAEWIDGGVRVMWDIWQASDNVPDNARGISWDTICKERENNRAAKSFYDVGISEVTALINFLRPLIEAETKERCAGIAERFAKTSEDTLVDLFDFTTRNRIESRMLEARSIASALRAEGNPK